MNGHSHTSQATPSFDALFGDRTGLTPYGAGPNDPNPFDSNYALALAQRAALGDGATQYVNFDGGGGAALLDAGFGPDKTPPSDNSPPNGLVNDGNLAGLDSSAMHALNTFNGSQQYDSNMAQRLYALRGGASASLNMADAEHLALPGVRYGDSVNIQTNKPLSHLDLLRRNSSEQSVDSSSSVSPTPTAVQNRKLGNKMGARRGGAGGNSAAEVKRGSKATTGEPAPKVRRRSTAASTSSPVVPDGFGDDDGKRAEFLERNRIAASKCRHKKKEWTNNLEAAARQASQQSRELQAIVAELQSELIHYQNELLAHQNCGNCDIQSYLGNLAQSRSHSYDGDGYHQ